MATDAVTFFQQNERRERSNTWRQIGLVLLSFLVSGLIEYGVLKERMDEQERRIAYLESQNFVPGIKVVTHDQFDQFSQDLMRRLGAIEETQQLMLTAQRKQP